MTDVPSPPWTDLEDFWTALLECHHNLPAMLRVIADRVVGLVGDGCVLTTVTEDGTALHPRAIAHADPVVADAMRAVLAAGDTRIGEGIAGTVASDRRPIVLDHMSPEAVAETTPARFLPFLRDHPMRAVAIMPLVAGGELLGTLGSVRTSSDDPYTIAEVRLMEALAERAALAIAEAMAGPRAIGASDYEAIFQHSVDGVLITTPDGHVLAANPAACTILGRTEREIVHGGRDAIVVADDPRLHRALAERAASGRARAELALRRGDGSILVADVASTIFTTHDLKARALVIFRDVTDEVTERQQAATRMIELEQSADRDLLTGLWNRRGFGVGARQALATADRQGTTTQLVIMDIDEVEAINDVRGRAAREAAIIALAAAVDRTIRDIDLACRLGGGELVVLLADTPGSGVPTVVARVREELAADGAAPAGITFTTGVVERRPGLEATMSELIDAADRDRYQQKVLPQFRRS